MIEIIACYVVCTVVLIICSEESQFSHKIEWVNKVLPIWVMYLEKNSDVGMLLVIINFLEVDNFLMALRVPST